MCDLSCVKQFFFCYCYWLEMAALELSEWDCVFVTCFRGSKSAVSLRIMRKISAYSTVNLLGRCTYVCGNIEF